MTNTHLSIMVDELTHTKFSGLFDTKNGTVYPSWKKSICENRHCYLLNICSVITQKRIKIHRPRHKSVIGILGFVLSAQ